MNFNDNIIWGTIVANIIDSGHMYSKEKPKKGFKLFTDNCRFTDTTILALAINNALVKCNNDYSNLKQFSEQEMRQIGSKYLGTKIYGTKFNEWLKFGKDTGGSYGNGAAKRVVPVVNFAKNLTELKMLSKAITKPTHYHKEGFKGAEATACAVFLAANGVSKEEIKNFIETNYYKLNFNYKELVEKYSFDDSCQNSVPQAIFCFLISKDFEDSIRLAISTGGDFAPITGSISGAYYGVPKNLKVKAVSYLDDNLKQMLKAAISNKQIIIDG